MKIEVFTERNSSAEKLAEFYDEDAYSDCVPQLEAWAETNGWHRITETISED